MALSPTVTVTPSLIAIGPTLAALYADAMVVLAVISRRFSRIGLDGSANKALAAAAMADRLASDALVVAVPA